MRALLIRDNHLCGWFGKNLEFEQRSGESKRHGQSEGSNSDVAHNRYAGLQ
jgi:hypothetical protein